MDDTAGDVSMVEGPDVERAVFVRGRGEVGVEVEVGGGEGAVRVGRGDVVVCRWGAVREAVLIGDVELI